MQRDPDRLGLALFWMTLSALGFSAMSIFVKRLSGSVPQFELVFFRSFVNFLIQLALVLALRERILPPGRMPKRFAGRESRFGASVMKLLVFRALAGFGGVSCFFYAIGHLPVSVAAMLNWCSPVFVILFSRVVLGERVARSSIGWIALVFVGLVLLLRPDLSGGFMRLPAIGVAIGILGAAFGGMAYVAVRAATARVGVNVIILYFTAIASLLSAPLALRGFVPPPEGRWLELLGVGVFASIGQIAMTHAYRFAAAGLVSTMSLLNAAFTALFGWFVFGEALTWLQWGGMLMLMSGISAITLAKRP